jgi:3-hydroxyacyl-CoA dehydrogenase
MRAAVRYEVAGAIAILTIDNPPVNATSHRVREGLVQALDQALADSAVNALVLICDGRTFVAGADIAEFGKPIVPPALSSVIDTFEKSAKPIVVAIHGDALGGGLELALGCHYRIALASAKCGLPEVRLGLLPGAGGTQRLPRLVGLEMALRRIVEGEPVSAMEAFQHGLVDRIAKSGLREAAMQFAQELIDQQRLAPLRVRDRAAAPEGMAPGYFDDVRARVRERKGSAPAPQCCVDAVESAVILPFDEGRARERELFQRLVASEESKALRYAFFCEREASKLPTPVAEMDVRTIRKVLVLGAADEAAVAQDVFGGTQVQVDSAMPGEARSRELCAGADLVICPGLLPAESEVALAALLAQLPHDAVVAVAPSELERVAALATSAGGVIGLRLPAAGRDRKLVEVVCRDAASHAAVAGVVAALRSHKKIPLIAGGGSAGLVALLRAAWAKLLAEAAAHHGAQHIGSTCAEFGLAWPAPSLEGLAVTQAAQAAAVSDEELMRGLVLGLAQAGGELLGKGIALRAGDFDLACIHALGWPSHKGGPMYLAKAWSAAT